MTERHSEPLRIMNYELRMMRRCSLSTRHIALMLLLMTLSLPAAATPTGRIIQRDHCTVPGETVTLGDVADVELPDPQLAASLEAVKLIQAPAYGYTTDLTQSYLVVKLKQHYGNTDDLFIGGSAKTVVSRDGALVTQGDIDEAIRSYIYAETEGDPSLIEIVPRGKDLDISVQPGQVDLRVLPSGASLRGNTSFRVEISVDGRVVRTIPANVFVRQYDHCLVTTKNVQAGECLNEENVKIKKVDITYQGRTEELLRDLEPMEGKVADRYLYAGRTLTSDMLASPTLVQNGAKVKLLVKVGRVQVMAEGIAKAKGSAGDTIRVLNLISNKMSQGIIDENGCVVLGGL